MTILISSTQADLTTGDGFGSLLREFGGAGGQPDLFGKGATTLRGVADGLGALQDQVGGLLSKLYGANQEVFDKSFVGSGRQVIAGGGSISGGKVSPLEDAALLTVTNQTPNLSVLVKKRAFSSLNHLYDPTLMDDDELWLFRATKRLFARKCAEVADYERLSKIKRILEAGTNATQATISLITGMAAQFSDSVQQSTGSAFGSDSATGFFSSMRNLQNAIKDRQSVDVTTWFYDPDIPFDPPMGSGSGVFEITLVSTLNTNLAIDGSGSCSFTLENPYNILRITEHDIELAIRDTALSKLTSVLDKAAGLSLSRAQASDAQLNKARKQRGKSAITFTVSASGQGAVGTIDAIGMDLTADNLDYVPEPHSLDGDEKTLVRGVLVGLEAYSMSTRRNLLDGLSVSGGDNASLRKSMEYARRMLRRFHMGKLLIQPMDTINIFIDGGTRRSGETTDVDSSQTDIAGAIGNALGLQDTWQIDEPLLEAAWEKSGKWLRYDDFKKLYAVSGGSGMHVFGGLVSEATNSYSAEGGRYEVSINASSNMEWLRLSRYNQQPALQQTEGIIWDPLTPFDFNLDEATGLPIGKAQLSQTNRRLIQSGIFLHRGKNAGQKATEENLSQQDIQVVGGSLMPIFEMPPGLKYRWKEGILTVPYTSTTVNPLDPALASEEQLRRDIGFFASNTAFDTMDAANIVSLMVTGYPHNTETFIKSALNTGGFQVDTTLNSGKDYFHSLLDVQRSINLVQGNFSPFTIINANRRDLAQAVSTQQRLSQKSSQLQQFTNQYAKVSDQLLKLATFDSGPNPNKNAQKALLAEQARLAVKLDAAANSFNELVEGSGNWRIAGDDVGFELTDPADADEAKLFGDRLLFVSQRRREDVIYNKDKNFLIVSEEYDKDFDIQSFALKMRERAPDMWKNTWDNVYELCRRAADMLDLEFFCNTQGHIELRPPQYNKTPLSVLATMLSLNRQSGIKVYPTFLEKLVSSRIQTLVTQVREAEYEMCRQAALLGASGFPEAKQIIFAGALKYSGSNSAQFLVEGGDWIAAISKDKATSEKEKRRLQEIVSSESGLSVRGSGLFSAAAQANLVRSTVGVGQATAQKLPSGNESFYTTMVTELVKLTGQQSRTFPSFSEARIGAKRNGQSNPASDVSAITDRISEQVTRRSKLLRILDKVLEQSVEIASANEDGTVQTGFGWSNSSVKPSELFERLVENDSQNTLGHLSGRRFIIGDESLLSYRVTEKPPALTICSVSGSADALAGVQEGFYNGALPAAKAIGADYDMWRQYGFRQDRNFDKPYFYDSELQCAPYAKMILTRQRREVLSAEAEVVGNEFYQLGDVVYLSDLQLVFYVHAVRHSFTYENGFSTTLSLSYGRPPGDYIPTPLDVIGKSLSNSANILTGARIRRLPPKGDSILGVVRFSDKTTDMQGLLGGQDGRRNYEVLSGALTQASESIDRYNLNSSPRVVLMAFGDASNKDDQKKRIATVAQWLAMPSSPGEKSDNFDTAVDAAIASADQAKLSLSGKMVIQSEPLGQMTTNLANLGSNDRALLKAGIVASQQAWALDETLDRIVEVRLRPVPAEGWPKGT